MPPRITRAELDRAVRDGSPACQSFPVCLTEYDLGLRPGVEPFPAVVDATGSSAARLGALMDAPTYILTVSGALWPGKMN